MEPQTAAYLDELPEVRTSRLPRGALFWANGSIYEVFAVDAHGFQKARLWRQPQHAEVALVPESLLSRYLPVVAHGRMLPVYSSQNDLLDGGECSCYVFPTEMLALDAAYLDAALILRSGPYIRQQEVVPALALTDGIHLFRLYYFRQSAHGRPADLSSLRDRSLGFRPRPHTEGPGYWRLLPSWTEHAGQYDTTQQSLPAVRIDLPDTPAP